jgi:hypothetical protein
LTWETSNGALYFGGRNLGYPDVDQGYMAFLVAHQDEKDCLAWEVLRGIALMHGWRVMAQMRAQ